MKYPNRTADEIRKGLDDVQPDLKAFCAANEIAYRSAIRIKGGGCPSLENWMKLDNALTKYERAQRKKGK